MKHEILKVNEKEVNWDKWSKSNEIKHKRKKIIEDKYINKLYCDIYEIPPGKANWPVHYHTSNEEVFYIIEGHGELISCNEIINVKPGDFLRFPAGEKGTHQLKNTSNNKPLKYLDFGTAIFPDVVFMPDDNKIELFAGQSGQDKMWSYDV